MEEKKIVWNSKFLLNIKLENKQQLQYIPLHIYTFKQPNISFQLDENMDSKELKAILSLRLDEDGNVEQEVYEVLTKEFFAMDLYYPRSDCWNWTYNHCSIDEISYDEFYNKSKNDRPMNINLTIAIPQAVFKSSKGEKVFGDLLEEDNDNG